MHTETDANDLTYFMDYHLSVISGAIEGLVEYLQKKAREVDDLERLLHSRQAPYHLNHGQLAFLSHALRNPGHAYTIKSHEGSHRIAYLTARGDLLGLEKRGLLGKHKRGREYVFRSVPGLEARLSGSPQ